MNITYIIWYKVISAMETKKKMPDGRTKQGGLIEKVRYEQTLEESEELAKWTEREQCSRQRKQPAQRP